MSLDTISQIGQKIGSLSEEQDDIKQNINPEEANSTVLLGASENVTPFINAWRIYKRDVSGDALWDFDYWNNADWEGDYSNPLVLFKIYNQDNTFVENFSTTHYRDSTNTTAQWQLGYRNSNMVLVDCESTSSWSGNGTNTVSLNSTTYKVGSGAINLIKSDTTNSDAYYQRAITNKNLTGKYICYWLYIKDAPTLAKIDVTSDKTGFYLMEPGYAWYKWYPLYGNTTLAVGWNYICINTYTSRAAGGASAANFDLNNIGLFRVDVDTVNTSDTYAAGDVIIDDVHAVDTAYLNFSSSAEAAQSDYVAYNVGTINQARISVEGTNASDFTYTLAADGTNFEEVTPDSWHIFTNTGSALKWKATNSAGGSSSSFPTAWGTWGGGSGTPTAGTIERLQIEYVVA